MLECKTFEIRDRNTFIPVFAVLASYSGDNPCGEDDAYLIRRAGYAPFDPENGVDVILGRIDGTGRVACDPYDWCDRTFTVAHNYIRQHWSDLESGAVVDVEYILGETDEPKQSERLTIAF